jgi:hypothetical protein
VHYSPRSLSNSLHIQHARSTTLSVRARYESYYDRASSVKAAVRERARSDVDSTTVQCTIAIQPSLPLPTKAVRVAPQHQHARNTTLVFITRYSRTYLVRSKLDCAPPSEHTPAMLTTVQRTHRNSEPFLPLSPNNMSGASLCRGGRCTWAGIATPSCLLADRRKLLGRFSTRKAEIPILAQALSRSCHDEVQISSFAP